MVEYRAGADPEYPGIEVATFKEVFDKALKGKPL